MPALRAQRIKHQPGPDQVSDREFVVYVVEVVLVVFVLGISWWLYRGRE